MVGRFRQGEVILSGGVKCLPDSLAEGLQNFSVQDDFFISTHIKKFQVQKKLIVVREGLPEEMVWHCQD